jgi:putative oxidoreductase
MPATLAKSGFFYYCRQRRSSKWDDTDHSFYAGHFIPFTKFYGMKHYHIISRIAIYTLSVVLIIFGIFHFLYPRDLLVYVPSSLIGGILWAYITGGCFVLVGISFLTNQFVKFTGYLLAAMLIIFIGSIHVPNFLNAGDAEMRQLALISILKDLAIMGFALHIAAGAHHQHFHLEDSD